MANGTQLGADPFVRANENPLSQSGKWTTISGFSALQIVSNQCEATALTTNCGALYTGVNSAPDQYVEVILGTGINLTTSQILLVLRSDASRSNAYVARLTGTTITIFKVVSGTPTQIAQATGASFGANSIIRFTASGVNLLVFQDFVLKKAIFDNTVASGSAGLHFFTSGSLATGVLKSFSVGFPSGNTNGVWTKQGIAMVPTTADINGGSIFSGISNPTMLYEGNAQLISPNADGNVFKMWFMGGNSIFYAESNTCLPGSWTRRGTAVLTGVGLPRIFKNGSTYYLHVNSSPTTWTQIDQYTSSDGITWALAHANILSIGGVGQFDHTAINYLSVIAIIGGTWTALYSGQNGSAFATGLATSPDGITWTKSVSNPVMSNYGVPEKMYLVGGRYYGWLSRVNPGLPDSPTVRLSTSDFITDWTTSTPVFAVQPDNAFEGVNHAHGEYSTACVLQAGSTTYLVGSVSEDDSLGSYHLEIATSVYPIAELIIKGQEYFGTSAQTDADNFTRSNENPLSQSGKWTTPSGMNGAQIVSNVVQQTASGNCGAVYTGGSFGNDHYSEITLNAITGAVFASVRWSTSAFTGYLFSIAAGSFGSGINCAFQRYNATVLTTLFSPAASLPITFQSGDKIRLSVTGDGTTTPIILSAYQNGSLIMQAYDFGLAGTVVTSGFAGFILSGATPGNSKISAFTAGNANVAYVPVVSSGQPFSPVLLG